MQISDNDHLVDEADRLIERTGHRIQQYRQHVWRLEDEGRESEGATLVLVRLQRVLTRLQLYRSVIQDDNDFLDFQTTTMHHTRSRAQVGPFSKRTRTESLIRLTREPLINPANMAHWRH